MPITPKHKSSQAIETPLKRYKQIMRALMNPTASWHCDRPMLRDARKLITEYKNEQKDPVGVLDLQLTYVEAGNNFTCRYGDIDSPFYDSLINMLMAFQKAVEADKENLLPLFQNRIKKLAQKCDGMGWGYGDAVNDIAKELGVL